MRLHRRSFLAGASALAVAGPAMAAGDDWPTRSIRLLTPWPAGGPLDTFFRLCQPFVSARLGQQVIVDNKPGAAGVIGTVEGKNSPPDGYTIITTGASFVTQPLVQKARYDVEKDFAPISRLVVLPQVLAVHQSLPAKTLREFIDVVQGKPGEYNYASYGNATSNHFAMELLKMRTGIKIEHIPYKGGAPAMQDVLGGRVQAIFTVIGDGAQHFRTGVLRPLALAHPERLPELPDVPTFTELGYKELSAAAAAFGLIVPIATPKPIQEKIGDAFRAAIADPSIAARLKELSMIPVGTSSDGYRDVLRAETATFGEVIRVAGIRIEE
jgi:tripartite-type tricarboxylate transporter receptor subunit TctC